jgi:hypothetical protein
MAFSVVNAPAVSRLDRGCPIPLGSLGAANQAVQFAVPSIRDVGFKKMVVTVAGTLAGGTFVLEGSLDNFATCFVIPPISSDLTTSGAVDTAAVAVNRYDVSGLGGAQVRFGTSSYTSGSGTVWALMD